MTGLLLVNNVVLSIKSTNQQSKKVRWILFRDSLEIFPLSISNFTFASLISSMCDSTFNLD